MWHLLQSPTVLLADTISSPLLPRPSFDATLKNVLSILFMAIALISVIFVVYGGFKYTVSNGDPQGIASAKNTIVSALVGLVISLVAFTIVGFVAGAVG